MNMGNKKGRPAKNKDSRLVSFRMTKQNFDWLKNISESENITMSDVLQNCVTQHRFEKPKVEIKDYEKDIHYLLLSLQSVGISIDYPTADLVNECYKIIQSKGGDANIEDMVHIKHNHIKKWQEYFKNKKPNDQEEK